MRRRIVLGLSAIVHMVLTTTSVASEPTAVEIVERAMAAERWIHDVESIRFRIESEWRVSERELAARRLWEERYRRADGLIGPVPDDLPHLQPRSTASMEIAFDTWRYMRTARGSTFQLQIWDGTTAYFAQGPSADSIRGVGLASEPTDFGHHLLGDLSWLRTDQHRFWFSTPGLATGSKSDPQRFTLVGRERFRDVECYVVETDSGFRRWYVAVEDGMVRGMQWRAIKERADLLPLVGPIAEARGVQVADMEGWVAFLKGIEGAERRAVYDEYYAAVLPLTRIQIEHFLDDYEEAAPGCWVPRLQGYTSYREAADGDVYKSSVRTMRVADLRINELLDDALFAFEVPEGVEVTDRRFDVPFSYRADADRSEEELQALLADARRVHGSREASEISQAELVGQAAPQFPIGATWHNGEPVTWNELEGKVVVLAFFANWCGPCRGMYPDLIELHEQRDRLGITVIGVHTPSTLEIVERYCEQVGIEFPVMIDVAPGNRGALGSACRVHGIPHIVVVRPDGTVAGSGFYIEMLNLAKSISPR